MPVIRLLVTLFTALLFSCTSVEQESPVIHRIAFGSCLKIENSSEQLWQSIRATRPNLFIFAGDNVYADSRDVRTLLGFYKKLEDDNGFRRLRTMVPMLAVYDDHDYGLSDGGKENPIKKEAAQACLDFFNVPADDPRRRHEGVYGSYTYGPPGRQVQVILLDTRYFRDPLVSSTAAGKRYAPNPDPETTLLGEEQWKWLERTLQEKADVRLLVSSIQVIPDKRGMESWGNFPLERKRLFEVIAKHKSAGVILLSGDAHFSEASRYDGGSYPLYEVTSSAMAHHHNTKDGKPTVYSAFPNEYRLPGSDFTGGNFGVVEIDWNDGGPTVAIGLKSTAGVTYFSRKISLKELQP